MSRQDFSFENLEVWNKSVEFARIIILYSESIKNRHNHYRLIEQLESAVSSVALNIAEGKGRYSKKDFIRFLYIARGSLYETIALLLIFNKIGLVANSQLYDFKSIAAEIHRMLSGLINSLKNSL